MAARCGLPLDLVPEIDPLLRPLVTRLTLTLALALTPTPTLNPALALPLDLALTVTRWPGWLHY